MYLDYFGLNRLPFSIAPDPDLLYLSPSHHEALAHLNYALTGHGGLICLTGEVGMGKTTLCRAFIDQAPKQVDIAYIFNPVLSAPELLQTICQELEISCESAGERLLSNKQLIDNLYTALIERYANGRKVVCIIDEAQSMPAPLLEQIRLLTNLETNSDKLLTLILVGQPELQETLAQYGIRQLDQRITARFHLKSMEKKQLRPYLRHRLQQAGCEKMLFSASATNSIWVSARGIPRLINSIADRALLGAYATSQEIVTRNIVKQAVNEVLGSTVKKSGPRVLSSLMHKPRVGACLFLVVVAAAWLVVGKSVFNLERMNFWPSTWGQNHYQALAQAYGVAGVELDSCQQIQLNSHYSCLSLDWRLAELRRLRQPLAIYDGQQWQVVSPDQIFVEPVGALVLWQPVEGFSEPVSPGGSHSLIAWVREQLAEQEDGRSLAEWQVIAPAGGQALGFHHYYDPILAQKVANFQHQVGLKADRIIGLKTLLALQSLKKQETIRIKGSL